MRKALRFGSLLALPLRGLSLLLGAPTRAFAAVGWGKPPPAWVREAPFLHTPLRLDLPYYPARGEGGMVLIPWDEYAEEAEGILQGL